MLLRTLPLRVLVKKPLALLQGLLDIRKPFEVLVWILPLLLLVQMLLFWVLVGKGFPLLHGVLDIRKTVQMLVWMLSLQVVVMKPVTLLYEMLDVGKPLRLLI